MPLNSTLLTQQVLQVSDVADKEVKKLEKSFKEGKLVRVRVLGFRRLEGLATGVLKVHLFIVGNYSFDSSAF